jgi:GAF domain-containing protein
MSETNTETNTIPPNYADHLLALSMQLNRQAFAQPPMDGWIASFLALLCERFASVGVTGAQMVQVVGNVAVSTATAGRVPAGGTQSVDGVDQYLLDEASPIGEAVRTRSMTSMPNARIFPVVFGNDAIGALIVFGAVSNDVNPVFGALAAQLGPATAGAFRTSRGNTGRLSRQIEIMRSLYEVTQSVSSALERNEVLNRAAQSLCETLQVDHVGIVVLEPDMKSGLVVSEYPQNLEAVGVRVAVDNALLKSVMDSHKPYVSRDVANDQILGDTRFILADRGIKTFVLIPMFVGGQIVGTVGLDSLGDFRDFTPEELEGATAIVSQLGISIRNTQLYEEVTRRATQLERIAELSRRITSTFDRAEIFRIIREETLKLLDAEVITVALRQPDDPRLYLLIVREQDTFTHEFDAGQTALQKVIEKNEALVIDDISGSNAPDFRVLADAWMRAALIVPMAAGGQVIGTFNVLHPTSGRYSALDLAVAEQIAVRLAVALENARLYTATAQRAETERLVNVLSGSLRGQGDLQNILSGTVTQIAEALGARRARVRLHMNVTPVSPAPPLSDTLSKLMTRLDKQDRPQDHQQDRQEKP